MFRVYCIEIATLAAFRVFSAACWDTGVAHCRPFHELRETSLPDPGKGGRLFSRTRLGSLVSTSPFTAMRHCGLSNLLDEERDSGRLRPVAGPVDSDEGDRVIASLGNVYDGSITGSGMV